jgi:hypothetical protein
MTPRVLARYCGRCLAIGLVVTVISAASPMRSARGEEAPQAVSSPSNLGLTEQQKAELVAFLRTLWRSAGE